jgi:DNA-binding CsgD family transcriptional regulator
MTSLRSLLPERGILPDLRAEAESSYLAIIITDSACNVKLFSSDGSAGDEAQNFVSAGGTRLRPEIEAIVSKLIEDRPAGSLTQSRVVLLDEERSLRFSPLSSPEGTLFAIIVERDHTYDRVGRAVTRFKLTRRQTEVLALVLDGASAGEIAKQLCISEYTAQGYIKSLLSKTASRNRAAMVARVLEWDLANESRIRPTVPTYLLASGSER